MYYSLLPGTGQLIEKNGNQGTALFRKHGYNVRNPNHYHYYNALRGPEREGFFDDLAGLLGGVAKVWGSGAAKTPASTAGNSFSLAPAVTLPAYSTSNAFAPGSSFTGNMNGYAPGRNAAYLELVNHFRNESIRRGYMRNQQIITNFYQQIPPVYSVGIQFQDQDQQQLGGGQPDQYSQGSDNSDQGNGFGDRVTSIRTPLFIIGGIILALIIWSKVR